MMQADYLLGVDGGNTKTIALVARRDGSVMGVGRAGCSDIYTNPDPHVPLGQTLAAVEAALQMAGIGPDNLAAGAFSLAGADWPEDFDFLRQALEARGLGRTITIVNDAVGALRAGSATGPAVCVVCGTGAATSARSEEGEVWHTSWWQDPQGGHQLGMKTLRAVYRAELGIDGPTALTDNVLRHFGQATVEDVLHIFTDRDGNHPLKGKVTGLARVLFDVAGKGDAAALRIVHEHGEALGDYALAAARRVGIEHLPFTLVLSGGVLRHPSRLLPAALIARVHQVSPAVTPYYSPYEPAVGALFLAFDAAGIAVDGPVLAALEATLPDADLFAT